MVLLRGVSPQMPNHRLLILVQALYGVVMVYFHVCISSFMPTKIYHPIGAWDSKVSLLFLELKRRYPPRLVRTTPRMAYLMQSLGYCNSFHIENIIYRHGHLETNLESMDVFKHLLRMSQLRTNGSFWPLTWWVPLSYECSAFLAE